MEHEVHVPVSAELLRDALADPARVARAVPGLQQDAGGEPGAGRLRIRVGSHSVTYRGTVRVTARADGAYTVAGDATESRGTGSVRFALTLRPRGTDTGSTLAFDGTATADGRVAELPPEAVRAAALRLLDRFAQNLAATATATATEPTRSPEPPADDPAVDDPAVDGEVVDAEAVVGEEPDDILIAETFPEVTEIPDVPDVPEPPAEAAHARRTMIGRSAEEVDHAPPRGRYAPVPAPQSGSANATLRWAAPAAALVVASVIVVGRALRKRH